MHQSKLFRIVAIAALAGSAGLTLAAPAGASATKTKAIHCTSLTGNIATTVTLSGCSGNTGGSSQPIASTALATGGTVNWASGKTTTVTLSVKQKGKKCPAGSSEYQAKGSVTADTTGSATVGGAAKATACVNAAGAISLVPGTKATI